MPNERGPDDSNGGPTESRFHSIARGFVSAIGGEEKGEELDEELTRLAPDGATSSGLDALVSAGLAVGASRAEIRRTMQQHADARAEGTVDGPLVQAREVEENGEFIGIRLFVDAPPEDVDVYRGQRSLMVRTPAGTVEEPIGFDPATIDVVSQPGSSVAEYLIKPPVDVAAASPTALEDADLEGDSDADADGEGESDGGE